MIQSTVLPTSHRSWLAPRLIRLGLVAIYVLGCDARAPKPSIAPNSPPPGAEPDAHAEPGPEPDTRAEAPAKPSKLPSEEGVVGTKGRGAAPKPVRVDLLPLMPAANGPADERLLYAMRRQLFITSVTDRARALITLAKAKPKDRAVAKVHRLFVDAQWAIKPGKRWLEGMRVAKGGMTDQRTAAFMDALMKELEARNVVARSVEKIEALAKQIDGPAYGIETCHREADDMTIRRPKPKSPKPLERPPGVSPGTRSDIIVHIDQDGYSWLAASVNANPGKAARACYAAVGGQWTPVTNADDEPAKYCRFIRCVF